MAAPRKLGVLVAIPIKGRKLLNRSGSKQSPYVQLTLGNQKKRTKASLIASVEPEWDQEIRLDVFQGMLNMHVSVIDEGKKNELIGDGILLLHEVVDKGELDVWFPLKYSGSPAGDVYFELTFYALAPPPVSIGVGARPPGTTGGLPSPLTQSQIQHPAIRYTRPNIPPRALPHTPPVVAALAKLPGPPAPYPGNTYHHPAGHNNNNTLPSAARPYPIPHQHSYPPQVPASNSMPPYNGPPNGPGFNPMIVSGAMSHAPGVPFRPKTQYTPRQPQVSVQRPGGPGLGLGQTQQPYAVANNNNNNDVVRYSMNQQHSPPRGPFPTQMPMPQPNGHLYNERGHGQNINHKSSPPVPYPAGVPPNQRPSPIPVSNGGAKVTPMIQYNYSLGSFP